MQCIAIVTARYQFQQSEDASYFHRIYVETVIEKGYNTSC